MPSRKLVRILAAVVCLLNAGSQGHAGEPSTAAAVPACGGRDLAAELADKDPAAKARIDAAAKAHPNGDAILWRVSRPGVPPSHLFGTIHLSDERITKLPASAASALGSAGRVVLEIADLSPEAMAAAMAKEQGQLVFEDARSLETMLTPDELAVASTAMAKVGFPQPLVAKLRPWLITMMLAIPDCERLRRQAGKAPLDLLIGNSARERGVAVEGLETIGDQLRALASVPDDEQLAMLKATIRSYAEAGDMIETVVARYLKRELAQMLPLQLELLKRVGLDAKSFDAFYKALLADRNPRMAKAAEPLLAKGGAFIAVGALHLVGDDGLVALLRKAGYEVVPAE